MRFYAVTLLLLLFEVNFNYGHSLSKIQLENLSQTYDVKEGRSEILVTHKKHDAVKLREIVYYHIIESPYVDYDISHEKVTRTFTNGHSGIPYEINSSDSDDDVIIIIAESTSDELTNDSSEESDSEKPNDESDNEQILNKNDLSKDVLNIDNDNRNRDDESKIIGKVQIYDINNKRNEDHESMIKDDLIVEEHNRNGDDESNITDKSIIDNDVSDKDKIPITESIEDPMNIDVRFSDFIIKTTEPGVKEPPNVRRKREIRKSPQLTGEDKSAATEDINDPTTVGNTLQRTGRTYGMSLQGDRGVVWNDINHLEYHVGDTKDPTSKPELFNSNDESTTESKEPPVIEEEIHNQENVNVGDVGEEKVDENDEQNVQDAFAEIEKIFDKLIDNEDKENIHENNHENGDKNEPSSLEEDKTDKNQDLNQNEDSKSEDPVPEFKEIEESFNNVEKVFDEYVGESTSEPVITAHQASTESADNTGDDFKVSSNGFFSTPKVDEDLIDTSVNFGVNLDVSKSPKRNDKDKETSDKEKQKEFVKELQKNKYFWEWLKNASAAYVDVMKKKLDAVIKTEVAKQIEQYFREHRDEIHKQEKEDVQERIKDSDNSDTDKTSNATVASNLENNDLASEDTNADHPTNNLTKTDNGSPTNKHTDKQTDVKNEESPVKIEAHNLFGSSVGSAKVTNIFIYNNNKVLDFDDIKPIINDTDSVFVIGLDDKKPEHASNALDTTTEVLSSSSGAEVNDNAEEKDEIKDSNTDVSAVTPNDQSTPEAVNNDDKTSTENPDKADVSAEKPVEVTADDLKKDNIE